MTTRLVPLAEPFDVLWRCDDGKPMRGVAFAIGYSTEPLKDLKRLADTAVLIVRRENGYLEAVSADDVAAELTP